MAREYPTLLELVGGTPIVRLDRIGRDVAPTLNELALRWWRTRLEPDWLP